MNIQIVEQLLNNINHLSNEERDLLLYKINHKEDDLINSILFKTEIDNCIYCSSFKIHKHDKRKNKQRYKCFDCKKNF